MRRRPDTTRREPWLARLERRLLTFLGPAQLGHVGKPRERDENRTAGVQGRWELRRDSSGRTYLVDSRGNGSDETARARPGE